MYSRAFMRFWWLLLLGLVVGVAVGGFVADRHKAPTYSAYSQLLVDSAQHPFLRASIPAATGSSSTAQGVAASKAIQGAVHSSPSADTQVLVNAANFYPTLINSDVVTNYRIKHYGTIPGAVHAKALDAMQGQNRYVPSIFPIIEIDSIAPSAAAATRLATVTATGFRSWLAREQQSQGIPKNQRISVVPIVMPNAATEQKHTRYSLAIVAGIAVFAGFLGLAVALDRAYPRRKRVEAPDERQVEQSRRVEVAQRAGL